MEPIRFRYKNYRGEITERFVEPDSLEYITVPDPKYGYQPGWFLSGWDQDKDARRSFALSHIILDEGLRTNILTIGSTFRLLLKAS